MGPFRTILAAAAVWGFSAGAAAAGDRAEFSALGYGEDGRHFAFEQYGVQDGSGFPYAEIAVIDLQTGQFAAGSPFHERIDDEAAGLSEARILAFERAEAALAELGIQTPARLVALAGDGEPERDEKGLDFGVPGFGFDDIGARYRLAIEIFPAETPLDCQDWFEEPVSGFALHLAGDGEAPEEVFRDTSVPRDRNCAVDYRPYAVILPFGAHSIENAVAVVSVWSRGFEGHDRRFLALPLSVR